MMMCQPSSSKTSLPKNFICDIVLLLWVLMLFLSCFLCLHARLLVDALWSPAGKELTFWLSFNCLIVTLSLSHWFPRSGVVFDCIDS